MMTCVSLNTWEQECAKMKIHFPNLYGIVENDTDVSNSYGFDPLTNAFLQVTWWCSNQNCDAQTRIIHVQLSYMSRDLPSTEVCSTALYFPWSIWSVYKKCFGICQLSFNKKQFSSFTTKTFSSLEESGGRKSYLSLTYDLQHATFTTFYTSLPCPLVTVIYGKTTANTLQAKYEFKSPSCLFHWVNVHTSAPFLQLRLWGSIKNKNGTPGRQRILIAFLIEAELPKIYKQRDLSFKF